MSAVSFVDRLSDQQLVGDIATAATAEDVVAAVWALKRQRNDRGMCAVCSGPLRGRRIVYCSDRCVHAWATDIRRIEQREHGDRWRQVSLACCETDEQREARPPKQTTKSRLWVQGQGVWATARVGGRSLTARVSVQAIADHMTYGAGYWLDCVHVDVATSTLLSDRIRATHRVRLMRAGESQKKAARKSSDAACRARSRFFKRHHVTADVYEAVADAIVSTGEWRREEGFWPGDWVLRRITSPSDSGRRP